MIIHTVKEGETVFHIARKYSVAPTKIIEDNAPCGINLTVGQQLLILSPTRTVTVKGGDSISSICHRFGIKRSTLIANNPAICGKDTLRPGQILAVKYAAPPLGSATALGIYEPCCSKEKYKSTLPYLTYVAISSAVISGDGIKFIFDNSEAICDANTAGKVPLLGICDMTCGEYLYNPAFSEKIIEEMIIAANAGKFKGIYLCATDTAKHHTEPFLNFLLSVRKRMIGSDLILFSRLEGDTPTDAAELSDGGALFADKMGLHRFADESESGKIFVNLDCRAMQGEQTMTISDALSLALRSGATVKTDEKTKNSYFEYNRYKNGVKESCKITFPSLEATEAMLRECSELGFMGFSFNINLVPTSYLCMFNTQFSRADYSLFSSEGEM